MPSVATSGEMTPRERLAEVADILARGVIRVRATVVQDSGETAEAEVAKANVGWI